MAINTICQNEICWQSLELSSSLHLRAYIQFVYNSGDFIIIVIIKPFGKAAAVLTVAHNGSQMRVKTESTFSIYVV